MEPERLKAILDNATSERIRDMVLSLEPRQPAANRNTVPVHAIVDALAPELAAAEAADRLPVEAKLRLAVLQAVRQIPDMIFVETDG